MYAVISAPSTSDSGGPHNFVPIAPPTAPPTSSSSAAIMPPVRTVTATRYVTPLREGGSMPGLVEADDDGLYVLKFRGGGQGPKALAAELVAGEVARSRPAGAGDRVRGARPGAGQRRARSRD